MKVHIHELMNNIEDSSVNIEEQNVVSSERIKELTRMKIHNSNTKRNSSKKGIVTLGIAVAVVAALGVTAFAAFGGGLDGILFNKAADEQAPIAESDIKTSDDYFAYAGNQEYISLQGYTDSPEYMAAKEWRLFEDNYDKDYAILDSVGNNPTQWNEKYGVYGVYSQEMADKVDEIAAKYNLTLHENKLIDVDESSLNAQYGEVLNGAMLAGYGYADGTFNADGEFDGYPIQLGRVAKGTFDTVYLNIGSSSSYEQWTYTTASGVTVLLCLSHDKALIIADLEESFVSVNVLLRFCDKPMDKAQLENLADHIHFENL